MFDLLMFCGHDITAVTLPAMQLEACMLADPDAQARYAAIYGEPWQSLTDALADFRDNSPTVVESRNAFTPAERAWFARPLSANGGAL